MLPDTSIDSPYTVVFLRSKVTEQVVAEGVADEVVVVVVVTAGGYCQESFSVIEYPHGEDVYPERVGSASYVSVLLNVETYLYWKLVPAGMPSEMYLKHELATMPVSDTVCSGHTKQDFVWCTGWS